MIDLDAIAEKWLKPCGSCDAGLPMGCTCSQEDFRPDMLRLVQHIQAQQDRIEQQERDIEDQSCQMLLDSGQLSRQRVTIAEQGDTITDLRDRLAEVRDDLRYVKSLHEGEDKSW